MKMFTSLNVVVADGFLLKIVLEIFAKNQGVWF